MNSPSVPPPIKVMVASSVYGFETDLDQIVGILNGYGYSVMNSRTGTIYSHPNKSNLENCLEAVRTCDAFLGIIRPFYGSGKVGERSITHEEIRLAISLNKPRWFLVHGHVTFARQLLKPYKDFGQPPSWVPQWLLRRLGMQQFQFKRTAVMDDLRVIDMYDDAIRTEKPVLLRTGNWAQEFYTFSQISAFLKASFSDIELVRAAVQEMKTP